MTHKQNSATGVNRVAVHLVFPSMTAALQHTSDAMIRPLHETKMGNVLHSALHDSFSPSTHISSLTFPSDFDTFGTQDKILFNKYNWCMNSLFLLKLFPTCQFYHTVFYYVNLFPLSCSFTDYALYFML
jgi:hypothetical protein